MSELSRQLALARQKTSTGPEAGRRTRVSVLFEKHEGADLDRQTVYHLGLSGLEDLVSHGAEELEVYRDSIFVSAIAEKERHMLDKDLEQELAKSLDRLLFDLAPYIMEPSAHRILEYLTRHCRVHIHNVDALLTAILLYHETDIFAKIVCLPVAIDGSKWLFLKNVLKSRQPISRQQLLKAVAHEPTLLGNVYGLVKHNPSNLKMVAFFALLASLVLQKNAENTVAILVPACLELMRDVAHPESQRAGYLIAAQMAQQTALSDKAITLFLLAAIRKASEESRVDALRCAAIVYSAAVVHTEDLKIPPKCMSKLQRYDDHCFGAVFAGNHHYDDFLSAFYVQLVDDNIEKLVSLASICAPSNLQPLVVAMAKMWNTKANAQVEELMRTLTMFYPEQMDHLVNTESIITRLATAAFVGESFAKHRPMAEADGATLAVALLHSSHMVRKQALQQLHGCPIESVGVPIILERILDEDVDVAVAALQYLETAQEVPEDDAADFESRIEQLLHENGSNSEVAQAVVECLKNLKIGSESVGLRLTLVLLGLGEHVKSAISATNSFCQTNAYSWSSVFGKQKVDSSNIVALESVARRALSMEFPNKSFACGQLVIACAKVDTLITLAMQLATHVHYRDPAVGKAITSALDKLGKSQLVLESSVEKAPQVLLILCTLLGAPKESYDTTCGPAVVHLVDTCIEKNQRLQILLHIACGALEICTELAERRAAFMCKLLVSSVSEVHFLQAIPFMFHLMTHKSRLARIVAADFMQTCAALNSKRLSKQPTLPKLPKCDHLQYLLDLVVRDSAQFIEDPMMLSRTLKTCLSDKSGKACVATLFEFIEAIVQQMEPELHPRNEYSMKRCVDSILRPLMKSLNPADAGSTTISLAAAVLEKNMISSLHQVTELWLEPECHVDKSHVKVVFDALSVKHARNCVLKVLPRVFEFLTKAQKLQIFSTLVESVPEEGWGEVAFRTLNVLGSMQWDTDVFKFDKHPPSVLLEIIRCNIQQFRSESFVKKMLPMLCNQLGHDMDTSALTCINIALDVTTSGVDVDPILQHVLTCKEVEVRSLALEVLAKIVRAHPEKTVDTILPVLNLFETDQSTKAYAHLILENITKCFDSMSSGLMKILVAFVDALQNNIHDQKHLVDLCERVLRSSDTKYIWVVGVLLLQCGFNEANENIEQQGFIVRDLLARFSIVDQVRAMQSWIVYMHVFSNAENMRGLEVGDDDLEILTELGRRPCNATLARNVAKVVSEQLASRTFISALHRMKPAEIEMADLHGESGFMGLISHLHAQLGYCGRDDALAKLREDLCVVMDKITALLSVPLFVVVIQELLQNRDSNSRHLAIRQLATKVENESKSWKMAETVLFMEMAGQLAQVLIDRDEPDVNKQTALLAIDVLARHLSANHQDVFVTICGTIVEQLSSTKSDQVASSACLCCATLVSELKHKVIALVPKLTPLLIKCMNKKTKDEDAMLVQSASTCIHSLVAELAQFLSPYLKDIVLVIGNANSTLPLVKLSTDRIARKLGESVEPRVILGPLMATFQEFEKQKNVRGCLIVIQIVNFSIEAMTRPTLAAQMPKLAAFFANGMTCRDHFADDEDNEVEEYLVNSITSLSLLLSGNQMQKLFAVLLGKLSGEVVPYDANDKTDDLFGDLAEPTKKRKNSDVDHHSQSVALTVYLLCGSLADRIMSLSLPFIEKVLEYLLLDLECEPKGDKSWKNTQRTVRERALTVLGSYCDFSRESRTFDREDQEDSSRFSSILKAIMVNLDIDHHADNKKVDPVEYYESFVSEYWIPTIIKLANSYAQDTYWQTLHHEVLEFSHHESPQVRIATIQAIVALFEQVGEAYMVLLADTLPTIAVLLEDKDKSVKKHAHKAAKKLQQLSGEEIEQFLT